MTRAFAFGLIICLICLWFFACIEHGREVGKYLKDLFLKKFRASLAEYGIVIETFNLSDVVPDEATKEAIQKVVNAQNVLEQAKIEKQTAEVEAEKARITAKGKADAAVIAAEGQAQANAKLAASLTNEVIRQHAIEKWDGKLPQYSTGDNTGALLNIK